MRDPLIRGRGPTAWVPVPPSVTAALIIALGYYAGAHLGFALTLTPVPVSTLWPPNAILLAGLILTPARWWAGVLTAVFAAHIAVQFQSGVPTLMVLCWYISNCTEALIGALLLRTYGRQGPMFETFRGAATFFVCAGIVGPFVSSFIDAGFVVANGWGNQSYWLIWRTRFSSNVLATLTLVPVILMTVERLRMRQWELPRRRLIEAALTLTALVAICLLIFVRQNPGPGVLPALLYAPLPLLVAVAFRFGPAGVSASLLTCTLIAIWGAILGKGPFVNSSTFDNAISIQLFLTAAWIPLMSLAAVVRERARADANARWSEEHLAIAMESAQLGRWEWDIDAARLTWSDITRRMYELPPDAEVTPQLVERMIHPDDRPLLEAATVAGLEGRPIDVEFRIVLPDGRIKWILSKGKTLYDEDRLPTRLVGIKVDVTDRKTAEMEIRKRDRELTQSARISVTDELSIALANEVNQPLAAILANASAARRYLARNPPDLRELADIVEAIALDNRRAADVINRFGALLRREDAPPELLNVNDIIRGVVDIARNDIIARGVSMTRSLGEDLPCVLADVVQIQQVLLNLIINACDAMEPLPPHARRLFVSTRADGSSGVRVSVRDSGPGVSADRLEQIFEPFVTSKPKRLGLGLAICRSIVSAHDGSLWAENPPDGGTVFMFSLPAARAGSPEAAMPWGDR
jgi:signal transduction histidine kinase